MSRMSLEMDPTPVKFTDETTALATTMIATLWKTQSLMAQLNHVWIPDVQKWWCN